MIPRGFPRAIIPFAFLALVLSTAGCHILVNKSMALTSFYEDKPKKEHRGMTMPTGFIEERIDDTKYLLVNEYFPGPGVEYSMDPAYIFFFSLYRASAIAMQRGYPAIQIVDAHFFNGAAEANRYRSPDTVVVSNNQVGIIYELSRQTTNLTTVVASAQGQCTFSPGNALDVGAYLAFASPYYRRWHSGKTVGQFNDTGPKLPNVFPGLALIKKR